MKRWLAGGLAALLLLGALAWHQRLWLLLHVPPLVARLRQPIGPNQPIAWDRAEAPGAPPSERPPNVVVILTDDMGFNDVGLHGGERATVTTPHIDSLARDGVQFGNAYAGNAVCAPSRAMMLTGRYSTRFGFEFTPTPKGMGVVAGLLSERSPTLRKPIVDRARASELPGFRELGMRSDEITLAELLRERGYHTVHIGKWHLGNTPGFRPSDQGFTESLLMENGLYLPEDHPDVVNAKQEFDPIDVFLWANMRWSASFNDGVPFEPGGYLTDWWTDEAVRVIEANRHRPFFLYLAHWAPHTPLQALRSDYDELCHVGSERLRVYAAMLRAVDRSVGRVLAALEAHGLAEDTLVFFTSDNGGANYVGLPDVNRPFRGWKLTLFEGGTHVPFLLRWPARLPAGVRYDEPVSHLDVFATAAAAAGAPLPADRVIDGVDLVPFVTGEAAGPPHEAIFWRSGHYRAVLAGGWKLQVSARPERVWLHHLALDPTEQRELSAERPDKVAELRGVLDAHEAGLEPAAWPSFIEVPVSVDKTLAEPEAPDDEYVYWPN